VIKTALKNPGLLALLVAITLFMALALMPLRFAFALVAPGDSIITARFVQGMIWDGKIADLKIGALSLGNVSASLRPLPLLSGSAEYTLSPWGKDNRTAINGIVKNGWNRRGIKNLTGTTGFAGGGFVLPLSHLEFQNFSAEFAGDKCVSASGTVRLAMRPDALAVLNLGDGLLGSPQCQAGALNLPLKSASAMEQLNITLKSDGSYTATLKIQDAAPETAPMLAAMGFEAIAGGYQLKTSGQF
jgi:general secretion pathway protein N